MKKKIGLGISIFYVDFHLLGWFLGYWGLLASLGRFLRHLESVFR